MKVLLSAAGVLAWLFGLMLLVAPTQLYGPTGIALTPILATIAQAHGATLIGLGTVNWFGRDADGAGLRAILIGNVVTQVASFAVDVRTAALGGGAKVLPAFVIHTALGVLFLVFLFRSRRSGARVA
jgi:hypothetical protein